MALEEIMNAVKKVISSETKADCGELVFEFHRLNHDDQHPDLTSAIFPLFNSETNYELSFSRFLSADFTSKPFVLVSKMRHGSCSEDNVKQSQSTPASIKSNESSGVRTDSISSSKKDGSDVWGSPLKCNIPFEDESISSLSLDTSQMPLERKKQRPKRLGIPLNLARKIISGYNTSVKRNGINLPSLVVLCDGEDRHTTALMGVKPFQVHTAKGFKMVTVAVDRSGAGASKATVKLGGGLSQACQAVYQVNADNQKPWASTVAVEIKWKGANRLLENPPMEANTQVKASVQSGNMQSCLNLYQELQFLERIISALSSGQVEWMSPSGDKPALPLTASVRALIEMLQEGGTLGSLAGQGEGEAEAWTFTTALKSLSIPDRKDYDFTDRLWKVMLDCMSTTDLLLSLRLVFRALGQGHLRPFVDRHNHTTVAQIVREAFTGRFSAPSLTGIQPFLFLAEMGAEKLRRDYIQIFVSQSLASPSTLEALMDPHQELVKKLENLNKLHNVLEMMVMLGASLRLPYQTLGMVARQMLAHYVQNPADPRHVFTFPVKTSEVRYVVSSLPPVLWCLETSSNVLTTQDAPLCQSSLHCLSLTQPLLHLQANSGGDRVPSAEKLDNGVELSSTGGDMKSDYCLVQRKETVVML